MADTILNHLLTDEEHKKFEEDGFLIIPNALPGDTLHQISTVIDNHYQSVREQGIAKPDSLYELSDCIGLDTFI
ncbi:MAG: hypothetical protein AAF639_34180 [Chloroflexota bacterium]